MDQNTLIAIDEDSLDQVAGGTCLPSPCDVVSGVLGAAGQVVGDVIAVKEELIGCGIKTLESLFSCGGGQ